MKSKTKARSLDRRQDIIDAAIVCYFKNGVINTTFTQIAKQARVHQPLISYYFTDFEALFAAVVTQMLEDNRNLGLQTIDAHADDAKRGLLEYAKINFEWARTRPLYNPLWTFFYHLASYDETFANINRSIRQAGRERVALLLYRYQEQQGLKLREDWNIGELAHAIHTQITGDLVVAVTEKADLEQARNFCENAVILLIESAFLR